MSIYQRYASGETPQLKETEDDVIVISPLNGRLELNPNSVFKSKTTETWLNIFPNAAYFGGYDESLFGHMVIVVYENQDTEKICTVSLTKFGVTMYHDLILNANSRFYPSCENLLPIHKNSKVRKALAITNLKNYNKLINHPGDFEITKRWDETNAGTLASKMSLLVDKKPNEFGNKLLQMGLITNHTIKSLVIDVVYDNQKDAKTIEENNRLVYLLGDQLDQLFDPLLEYSPEILENTYNIPNSYNSIEPQFHNNEKISLIIDELLTIQTNYTMGLVSLLQNFIIPLRIHILSATDSNGIAKINHIFPPTIDEITRINCVLHDSLLKAKSFGYVEIFKVFGMILPYFYKPFIRHEANLKNFKGRFNKFYNKYEDKIFKNTLVNKSSFSNNYIDSIITGSLLELPKMKLILVRLYDTVKQLLKTEKKVDDNEELLIINYYYDISIKIIDAFGGEDNEVSHEVLNTHERLTSKTRIFTPTGKILTELASNWPPELQYGWLTRKVIGIYELKNIKPDIKYHDLEIMIIFSDVIMFLKIVDDTYYVKNNNGSGTHNLISIPDILMHSLVNEKPLPKLSSFPQMEASHWCSIKDVVVTTYKSFSTTTSSEEDFLRILQYNGQEFQADVTKEVTKNYEILRINNSNMNGATGNSIIELVNKAKILHKSQPFHLFRTNLSSLHLYSTAHEALNYDNEVVKSQIVLLMNLSSEMVDFYLSKYPHIFLIFTVSFTYDGSIQLLAFSRAMNSEETSNLELNEVIQEGQFQTKLQYHISQFTNAYFNSFAPITELIIKANHMDLEYYLLQFQRFNNLEVRENMKQRITSQQQQQNLELQQHHYQQQQEQLLIEQPEGESKKEVMTRSIPEVNTSTNIPKKKKRMSIFRRLFKSRKSKEEPKTEYKELYRPTPTLKVKDISDPHNVDFIEPDLTRIEEDETKILEINPQDHEDHSDVETVQHLKTNMLPLDLNTYNGNGTANEHGKTLSSGTSISQPSQYPDYPSSEVLDYYQPIRPESIKKSIGNNESQSEPIISSVQHAFRPVVRPVIKQVKSETKEIQPQKVPETTTVTKAPFKELYDTSEETIDYKKKEAEAEPEQGQRPVSTPTSHKDLSLLAPPEISIQNATPVKTVVVQSPTPVKAVAVQKSVPIQGPAPTQRPLPIQRPIPVQAAFQRPPSVQDSTSIKSPVLEKDSRVPSLDINSQFEFPLSENAINDQLMNKSSQASLIKSVSESRLTTPGPLETMVLDDDGEANWITFSRDSSRSSIQSINHDANTKDASSGSKFHYPLPQFTHPTSNSGSFSNRNRDVSAADSFKEQILQFNNQILNSFNNNFHDSATSLTPSETARSFGKELEENFSSGSRLASKRITKKEPIPEPKEKPLPELIPELIPEPKEELKRNNSDAHEIAKRYSGIISEEEYFSPDEYVTPEVSPIIQQHGTHGSFSSENTIITEMKDDKDVYLTQFESMAYLSDILNGKIEL